MLVNDFSLLFANESTRFSSGVLLKYSHLLLDNVSSYVLSIPDITLSNWSRFEALFPIPKQIILIY